MLIKKKIYRKLNSSKYSISKVKFVLYKNNKKDCWIVQTSIYVNGLIIENKFSFDKFNAANEIYKDMSKNSKNKVLDCCNKTLESLSINKFPYSKLYHLYKEINKTEYITGMFISTDEKVQSLIGKEFELENFNEPIIICKGDIQPLKVNQSTIDNLLAVCGDTLSGINPFEYLNENDED